LLVRGAAPAAATDASGVSALMHACRDGHVEVAEMLLARGELPSAADAAGARPLHSAAAGGALASAALLLRRRARVDDGDARGETALVVAKRRARPEMVALLLAHGALDVEPPYRKPPPPPTRASAATGGRGGGGAAAAADAAAAPRDGALRLDEGAVDALSSGLAAAAATLVRVLEFVTSPRKQAAARSQAFSEAAASESPGPRSHSTSRLEET
jgi:hypothetical protein